LSSTDARRTALNLLPWGLQEDGSFALTAEQLPSVLQQAAEAGFDAVMADPPPGASLSGYRSLLAEHGMRPAPGYYSIPAAAGSSEVAAGAGRHAAEQAALGLTETFLATAMCEQRMQRPARGTGFDAARLDRIIDRVARAAGAMAAEGVRACLHPHVGTWIETEGEVRAVLEATSADLLSFGPDSGHLFWAGMDPANVVKAYADRVGGVHLKDVHHTVAQSVAQAGTGYAEATVNGNLWTELGRGDVDLDRFLGELPASFTGWYIVEVDVPDQCTALESSLRSRKWLDSRTQRIKPAGVDPGGPPLEAPQ
jgi:inosose dehydratase